MIGKKIKKRIIQKIKFELGLNLLEEENKSLHHLLNYCIDITKIPPTKDEDLRILQKCDTLLLAIFDKLCQMHGLSYWIDYGTLLGAVRHKGFIPWDNDIDVSMPREQIDQVMALMKSEVKQMGLSLRESYMHPLRCLVIGYKEEETGVWVDIFAVDSCKTNASDTVILETFKKYRNYFLENMQLGPAELTAKKEELLSSLPEGDTEYMLPLMEGWDGEICFFYKKSEVYPISRINFEGYELNAPANPNQLLQKRYGVGYMQFPKFAVNNHGRDPELSVTMRAKRNGIDMNEVHQHLQSIYERLENV